MRQPFAQGLLRRRRDREHDGDLRRPRPGRPLADARRRHGAGLHRARARLPEARRQDDLRQAVVGLRHRQRHPRRRAEPHPHPGEGAARGRADVAEHVPGAGLRGAGGGARGREGRRQREARRQARGQAPDHAVELRAVRRDHREGRAPDAARGRRRPELPGRRRRGRPRATFLAHPLPRPASSPCHRRRRRVVRHRRRGAARARRAFARRCCAGPRSRPTGSRARARTTATCRASSCRAT